MEDLRLAATESCENSGNVVNQLGVAPLSDTESVLKLIKLIFLHTQVASVSNIDQKVHFIEKNDFIIFVKQAFKASIHTIFSKN